MFTTGRIVFIVIFIIAFVAGLIYAYRKDLRVNRIHFRGALWILAGLLSVFAVLLLIIKLRG